MLRRFDTNPKDTKNVGILTKNPASLEEIVVQQYKDIKSRLSVRSRFDADKVSVDIKSDCRTSLDSGNLKICNGVKENQVSSCRLDR